MRTLKPILGTILCFIFVVSVNGKGKFVVILKNFTNTESKIWNNSCCEELCTPCDTYFKVCLTAFPRPSKISECISGVEEGKKIGPNTTSMNFKVERALNIKTQYFGVFVEAWDKGVDSDKLMDQHSATIIAIPTYNGTVGTSNTITLTGKRSARKTTLEIQYQLYCDRYYYGPTCGIYCKYRDDGNEHYWCDNNGTKVCLENWYGENCEDNSFDIPSKSVSSTDGVQTTRIASPQATEITIGTISTKLMNLSVAISTSTIVNTPSKSKMTSRFYVVPTMMSTEANLTAKMDRNKGIRSQNKGDQAWKYVIIMLGIVTFLVVATVLLFKYAPKRMRRRIGLGDHGENNAKLHHLDDRNAVPEMQLKVKGQLYANGIPE